MVPISLIGKDHLKRYLNMNKVSIILNDDLDKLCIVMKCPNTKLIADYICKIWQIPMSKMYH